LESFHNGKGTAVSSPAPRSLAQTKTTAAEEEQKGRSENFESCCVKHLFLRQIESAKIPWQTVLPSNFQKSSTADSGMEKAESQICRFDFSGSAFDGDRKARVEFFD